MLQDIPRWIRASVNKHFDSRRQGILLYAEGEKRATNEEQTWAEVRMNGPHIIKRTGNQTYAYIDINIYAGIVKDDRDIYRHDTVAGIFLTAFTNTIDVFKYGNETGDDQSFLFCLQLRQNTDNPIRVYHIGLAEPKGNVYQMQVDAHYFNDDINLD